MSAPDGALWASLPLPAVMLDGADRIGDVNAAAEAFLNLSARNLTGLPIRSALLTDAALEEAFSRVRQGRAPMILHATEIGTGADRRTCDLQIAPLGDTDNLLFLMSSRALAGRFERDRASSSAAKSAIGMAEMLAHEIKNPLAGIAGAAQLLSMSLKGEDLELTDLIVAETRRVVKLLDQVEAFGNVSAPARVPVNLHDVLDRARRSVALGHGAHMRFVDTYDPSLPLTCADPDQLQQVFQNLLKNAAEAGQPGGTITLRSFFEPGLRLRRKDGSGAALPLQVEIMDDGPGLPPDIAANVFEPFVSGRENGTGLGLALVAKIIADHEGWIAVDSAPGRTVFRISLPVAKGAP